MRRPRRALFAAVTLFLSLTIGVLVAEVLVRLLDLAPSLPGEYAYFVADAYLPHKPKPYSRVAGVAESGEFEFDYQHNSLGFRDTEHAHEKRENVFRILGLGDSFTYGVGARFEDTYLVQLEQMLNRRAAGHRRVEIIKAGMPRYFRLPERILLERYGASYEPDLILVAFLPNDVIDTYEGLDATVPTRSGYLVSREAQRLGRIGMLLYTRSHLGRLVLSRYVAYRLSRRRAANRSDEIYRPGGFHERDWRAVEREYRKIVSLAADIGARVVVVHIPQKAAGTARRAYPAKRLSAWAAANGAGFVTVLPALIAASNKTNRLYYENDGHCTPEGYAVIARAIHDYLVSNELVP